MEWVQQVYFEKELIADIVTIEGNASDESDMSNKGNFSLIHITTVANGKGTVDR